MVKLVQRERQTDRKRQRERDNQRETDRERDRIAIFPSKSDSNQWEMCIKRIMCVSIKSTNFGENY